MNTLSKGVLVALGLVTLASCGGGGGGVASGGAGGTGISQGPVSGFGSVFVNGIKFEDTAATIEVEDAVRTRGDLKVGMVVKVAWTRDAAGNMTATNINFGDDVQGPMSAPVITGSDATFTVLGHTVMTHLSTTFAGVGVVDAATLAAGNIVEVSGLKDAAGVIHATRVERKATAASLGETFELKGVVANLNTGATTFTLGTATVNYSGLLAPTAGACVEVKSTAAALNGAGELVADIIQTDDDCTPGGTEGQELEVKGFPSVFSTANNTLTVNGQAISYTDAAFVLGKTEADLSTAVIVEVEGSLSGGILIAKKISFEIEGNLEGKGLAQGAIDASNNTFTVNVSEPVGTGMKTFTVNNLTVYEDKTEVLANFGKADIATNQTLKVYYYLDGTTNVATRVKRE